MQLFPWSFRAAMPFGVPRVVVVVGLSLVVFLSVPAALLHAQAEVVVLESDRDPMRILRGETVMFEDARVGAVLDVDDQLFSSGAGRIQLKCSGGSLLTFAGRFLVLILRPAEGQDCAANLLSGEGNVISDNPTGMTFGEVTLSSERTVYGLRVRPAREEAQVECLVYDGAVSVQYRATQRGIQLGAGQKATFTSDGQLTQNPLAPGDIERTADLFARINISKAVASGASVPDLPELRLQLSRLYAQVLTNPQGSDARVQLAVQQVKYGIGDEALYHLDRAELSVPREDTQQQAGIAVTKAALFQQRGDAQQARQQLNKAQTLDPDILKPEVLRKYEIDPDQIRRINPDLRPRIDPDARTRTMEPEEDVHARLSRLLETRQFLEVLDVFRTHTEHLDESPWENCALALALYNLNRREEAIPYARKALDLNRARPELSLQEIRACRAILASR